MRAWAIIATVVADGTLAAGGTLAAMLLRGGISARGEPSSLEASLAFKARRMALRGSRDRRNPVSPAPEVISAGLSHFADHCASCHANDGSGQTEMGRKNNKELDEKPEPGKKTSLLLGEPGEDHNDEPGSIRSRWLYVGIPTVALLLIGLTLFLRGMRNP